MATCLGKSCSFDLLCMSFVNVYQSVCPSFPFGFEGGMWDVLIPDHCLSIYFLYKLYGTCDILRLKAFSETSTYYFFPFDGGQVLWSLV